MCPCAPQWLVAEEGLETIFLPGPRLVPSCLGILKGKKNNLKELSHGVALQPVLRARAQRTRDEMGFPLTIPLSLRADLLEPCEESSAFPRPCPPAQAIQLSLGLLAAPV